MRRQTTTLLVLLGALPTYHYRGRECAGGGGGVVFASAEVANLHDQSVRRERADICGTLAARGGCTVSLDWMSANCPASCSSGSGATTAAPPPPAAPPRPADAAQLTESGMADPATPLGVVLANAGVADLCGKLAARGGCAVSPDWMRTKCAASCSSGGGVTTAAPPPPAVPPLPTDAAQFSASGLTDHATPLPAEFIEVRPPDSVTAHAPPPIFATARHARTHAPPAPPRRAMIRARGGWIVSSRPTSHNSPIPSRPDTH